MEFDTNNPCGMGLIASSECDGDRKGKKNGGAWSTWEELLLASAVHRHGTTSWDSVAGELRKRCPSLHLVTHQICRFKFDDLKRRFNLQNDHTNITHHLKKLRVAELKRDVQRYDLSILSLQLKVKRLEQEREEEESLRYSSDKQERQQNSDLEKLSPAGKQVSAETSEHETVQPDRTSESAKMAGEGSCNGSSYSVMVREQEKIEPLTESKCKALESQPLVDFLEIIRSHRLASIFLRRMESQETSKYRSVVRQSIDLETIGTRLQQGWYADYNNIKFFRDMLLLSNNALVFYENNSMESKAAIEIRQLVSKEIAFLKSPLKLESVFQEQLSVDPTKNPDPELTNSQFAKQKIIVPLISCRKRSLILARPSANSSGKKKEKERPVINSKQREKSLVDIDVDDHAVTKTRTRERITPNPKISTKNSKGGALSNTNTHKNLKTNLNDKKNNNMAIGTDNAGCGANLMNKMKNGSISETVKNTTNHSNNSRRGSENMKNDIVGRRDNQHSNVKKVKEQESSLKKNVGRPTKTTIATPPPVSVKRSREGEDVSSSSRQARKRLRK